MMRTATEAVNAALDVSRDGEPACERRQRAPITIGTSPQRCGRRVAGRAPCRTGLGDEARDLRDRASPPRPSSRGRRAAEVLMVAPATSAPGSTSTGAGSPVSIDWSTADRPSTTTPSVGIFSPGPDDQEVAPELPRRWAWRPARPRRTRAPSRELEQRRIARSAPPRARLRVAAQKDERRDDRGPPRSTCGRPAGRGEREERLARRGERPQGDERVHRRRQVAASRTRGAVSRSRPRGRRASPGRTPSTPSGRTEAAGSSPAPRRTRSAPPRREPPGARARDPPCASVSAGARRTRPPRRRPPAARRRRGRVKRTAACSVA